MLLLKESIDTSDFDQSEENNYHLTEMEWHLKWVAYHYQEAADHLKSFGRHEQELKELQHVS